MLAVVSPADGAVTVAAAPNSVWIVDANARDAAAIAAALASEFVCESCTAIEVLARIEAGNAPTALVLDWHLAEPRAADVCRVIRAHHDELALPIFVASDRRHEADIVEALALGANDFLVKPVVAAELTARVKTVHRLQTLVAAPAAATKAAETERRKLSAVLHQSLVATAVLEGPRHVFTLANGAYLALVGSDDVLGKPLLEALPDLRGQGFDVLLNKVTSTGQAFRGFEVPVKLAKHRGDERLYVNFSYEPKRDAEGAIDGVLVSAVDVTDQVVARKHAEASARALKASDERLRRVLDASGAGLWELDAGTAAIQADRRTTTLIGLAPGAALTFASTLESIVPADRDRVKNAVAAALAGKNEGRYLTEFRTGGEDGNPIRWVESRAAVRFDDNGQAAGLAGAMIDITARKEAELAREGWIEALRAQPSLRICVLRGPELIFEMANAVYLEKVARGRSAVGRPLLDVFPEAKGQPAIDRLKHVLATGETYVDPESKAVLDRGDGTFDESYFSLVYQPVRGALGTVESVLVIAHDVTAAVHARHALEELFHDQREASRKSEEANLAKDEFLATASHELRTPLNAILGWARMLRSGTLDPSAYLRGVETIERNAKAQVQLIEDILDGSRIITGKLHLEIRPLDMTSLVRAALDAVKPAADAKGIVVSLELDPAAARITGDPERLQQIVWNLANNAVKFTSKGGLVDIRLERVGTSIQLAVADSGQGIEKDFLPHVFDRFRQAEGSTTRRHGGLGLGLALVRHLVEAHGGTVRAESEGQGQGARFVVLLPVQAVFEASPDSDHPRSKTEELPALILPSSLTNVHALVVDDEMDARDLVATVLRANGAQVTTAGSAAEALRLLAIVSPTIVISDIGMPEVDGYELIRRVRQTGVRGAELPAIALTAYSREQDRRLALEAGFQTHVAKPVEPAELVRVVASLGHFIGRQTSTVDRGHAFEKADTFLKLEKILRAQGIDQALRFLNSRTSHRFTGIYRFDGDTLRNVHLIDSYDPSVKQGDDAPMTHTYCSIVAATEKPFMTENTQVDDRLRMHPARDSVVSYCGILLRDAAGQSFGSLCHFDVVPGDVPISEMPLMEAAAPLLMKEIERSVEKK